MKRKKYKINESVFSKVNRISAYWAGFFMADGCLHYVKRSKNWMITLELAIKDKNHIVKFKKFVGSNHKISRGHCGQSIGISFYSKKMAQDLNRLGIVRGKLARYPTMLCDNLHFWRGMIDGDGCLATSTKNRIFLVLYGSKFILEQFKAFVNRKGIKTNPLITRVQNKNVYRIAFSNVHAYRIIRMLYKNCSIALDRKLKKAQIILQDYRYKCHYHRAKHFYKNWKLTERQKSAIVSWYKKGRVCKWIAARYPVTRKAVNNILNNRGIGKRKFATEVANL